MAQRTSASDKCDLDGFGASLEARRCHPQNLVRDVVELARRGEACVVDGRRHAFSVRKTVTETAGAMCDPVTAGRDAGRGLEQPVEVMRTEARMPRELVESRNTLASFDLAACLRHQSRGPHGRCRVIRVTTLARPITGGFGSRCIVEEDDVLAARCLGRARTAAVDTGRADGVDEIITGAHVALDDSPPAPRVPVILRH